MSISIVLPATTLCKKGKLVARSTCVAGFTILTVTRPENTKNVTCRLLTPLRSPHIRNVWQVCVWIFQTQTHEFRQVQFCAFLMAIHKIGADIAAASTLDAIGIGLIYREAGRSVQLDRSALIDNHDGCLEEKRILHSKLIA